MDNSSPLNEKVALAPTGVLRVAINTGNPLLAALSDSGEPFGVSVDIAQDLGRELGVPVVLKTCARAADAVAMVSQDEADLGFFAVDRERADGIMFSAPYVLIEGAYLVKQNSPITNNYAVDQAGNRVVVSQGSAYDHYLTRALQNAEIDRGAGPHNVVQTFLASDAHVAAGIRPQLLEACERTPGLHVLPGRFMVIEQALAIPLAREPEALEQLSGYIRTVVDSGFVADLLQRHEIKGARVADD